MRYVSGEPSALARDAPARKAIGHIANVEFEIGILITNDLSVVDLIVGGFEKLPHVPGSEVSHLGPISVES